MTDDLAPGPVRVCLLGVPAETVRYSQRYHDALVRELGLIILGPDEAAGVDLGQLRADDARLHGLFAVFRPLIEDQLVRRDEPRAGAEADLVLMVPPDVAELADEANVVFDRLEDQCGGGALLLARPPVLSSGFRTWFFTQLADQARGEPAVAWPDWWCRHGDGSAPVPEPDVLGRSRRS